MASFCDVDGVIHDWISIIMKIRVLTAIEMVNAVALFSIWIAAVIDPVGNFYGLRYISYAFCIATLTLVFVSRKFRLTINWYQFGFIVIFGVFLPAYGLLLFAMSDLGHEFRDTSYLAAAVLTIITLLYYNEYAVRHGITCLVLAGRLLSCLIILNAVFLIGFGDWSFASLFTENNIAIIGFRSYLGVEVPYINFLAAPILIFVIAYDCHTYLERSNSLNLSFLLLTFLAMLLTGTRGSAIFGILTVILLLFVSDGRRFSKAVIGLLFVALFVFFFINYLDEILSAFSTAEANNRSKIDDLDRYGHLFNNFQVILFGQGFNAHSWSLEFREMIDGDLATKTELTYLEIIRVFGFPIGFGVIIFLILISVEAFRTARYLGVATLGLLFNAAFNPYLFSSNGMLPLGLIVASFSYKSARSSMRLQG